MHTNEHVITCVVREKITVAHDTVTLCLETKSGEVFDFTPGQYVIVSIRAVGINDAVGKMYTMSSAPESSHFNITIRKIGPFSRALCDLSIGADVLVTGPYGELFPKDGLEQMVCFAGGIGITPFFSMMQYFGTSTGDRPRTITVFYSNKTPADAAFLKELDELTTALSGLTVVNTFTREAAPKDGGETGRIDAAMIQKYVSDIIRCDCFICGSIDFSDSMWRILTAMGVSDERIFIETFY
jgi:ferredoxin-NADP reductase